MDTKRYRGRFMEQLRAEIDLHITAVTYFSGYVILGSARPPRRCLGSLHGYGPVSLAILLGDQLLLANHFGPTPPMSSSDDDSSDSEDRVTQL
jgi:hypothetical protein